MKLKTILRSVVFIACCVWSYWLGIKQAPVRFYYKPSPFVQSASAPPTDMTCNITTTGNNNAAIVGNSNKVTINGEEK